MCALPQGYCLKRSQNVVARPTMPLSHPGRRSYLFGDIVKNETMSRVIVLPQPPITVLSICLLRCSVVGLDDVSVQKDISRNETPGNIDQGYRYEKKNGLLLWRIKNTARHTPKRLRHICSNSRCMHGTKGF